MSAPDGLLVVDKPPSWTSHDVVARVRRLARTKKVGHAGTLDPMATGVLLLGIGRATRLLGHLALTDKDYDATWRLGATTVTDDAEGDVLERRDASGVDDEALRTALAALTGEIEQVPSAVSAVKVDGVRSYARVRSGEQVALAARRVVVSRLELTGRRGDDVDVTCAVSSGTYVRALARDLGQALGVGAHLTGLRRTRVGPFDLSRARPLADLEAEGALDAAVVPLDQAVAAGFPRRDLDPAGGARPVLRPPARPDRPERPGRRLRPGRAPRRAGGGPRGRRPGERGLRAGMTDVWQGGRVQRWRGVTAVPSGWGRCVVTIGVFDGVHRGHQQIIGHAVARARALGLPCVVLTFDPHPSEVVRPGSHPPVLSGPRDKAELLEQLGVDVVCVLPFTREFSRLTPDGFVHEVLVEALHAALVVVGENFRYGARAAGDVAALAAAGRRFGFGVEGVPLVGSDDTTWSSTYVRSCVQAGEVEQAARALGREHRVDGVVVRGDQRGRELGYPTANLEPLPWSAVPADGVYAGRLLRTTDGGRQALAAAISIGTNPTFEGPDRRVEAYVLDFTGDLYGEHVGLAFTARLRDTLRFDGVEPLVAQMALDVERARELTSRPPAT